jgi:hypothetical protein
MGQGGCGKQKDGHVSCDRVWKGDDLRWLAALVMEQKKGDHPPSATHRHIDIIL